MATPFATGFKTAGPSTEAFSIRSGRFGFGKLRAALSWTIHQTREDKNKMKTASPLRYPGGKWRIASFFNRLIAANRLEGIDYAEPYAGGHLLHLACFFRTRSGRYT